MTSKEAHDHDVSAPTLECCMCGDYGLSQELFRCRICLSRSQHRYCSNLYPKAETYEVCNWCLNKDGSKLERTQSSLSFTYRRNNSEGEEENKMRIKRNNGNNSSHVTSMKVQKRVTNTPLHVNSPIKKQRVHSDQSIEGKKRVYHAEESLRRTKSEGMIKAGMLKQQVFRGKVRRYRLLEEVSIQ
ncbi:hypothetical protein IFM89_035707 [Coptis chinensis]|uniref:PHD-type zinc finger plants domain-containing protein n=1 Tax=Coptis chinensis TaxID=261450 RepID=A0A835IUP4_9MAGN|nr:hypothetical protein IFM89_035707 [Coptis chinensis]